MDFAGARGPRLGGMRSALARPPATARPQGPRAPSLGGRTPLGALPGTGRGRRASGPSDVATPCARAPCGLAALAAAASGHDRCPPQGLPSDEQRSAAHARWAARTIGGQVPPAWRSRTGWAAGERTGPNGAPRRAPVSAFSPRRWPWSTWSRPRLRAHGAWACVCPAQGLARCVARTGAHERCCDHSERAPTALIIRFGRELLESPQVSDDTCNAVRARYGEQGLLELTAVMSVYTMNANILRVMDHQAAADARHLTPR
jgi:hypothetical protein